MVDINHRLIKGEVLSHEEIENNYLMRSKRSSLEKARRFYQGVKYPNNINDSR